MAANITTVSRYKGERILHVQDYKPVNPIWTGFWNDVVARGGPLWPRSSFDLIALWNCLKGPEICFHIKIQVFSFPYTPKKVL